LCVLMNYCLRRRSNHPGQPPKSTHFPYTTPFRSGGAALISIAVFNSIAPMARRASGSAGRKRPTRLRVRRRMKSVWLAPSDHPTPAGRLLQARKRDHTGVLTAASLAAQVFVEPWHDFYEIAGAVAVIELPFQDLVPGVLAGAGTARQGKEIGPARDPARGPALHRRGADLLHRDDREDRREGLDLLLVDLAVVLDRDVAPGQLRAAGREDHVHAPVGDPGAQLRRHEVAFVLHDLAVGKD